MMEEKTLAWGLVSAMLHLHYYFYYRHNKMVVNFKLVST